MNYKYESSIIYFNDENIYAAFKEYADKNISLKNSRNVLKVCVDKDQYIDCSINVADAYQQGWKDCLKYLESKNE